MKKTLLTVIALTIAMASFGKIKPMNEFVSDLMSRMTLDEKIGQLNLMVAGKLTTGILTDNEVAGKIAEGKMGGIFNVKGVEDIRKFQELAVKKSRLGIPLLVGMDVIHGYETIFPIPLALSCSWDMQGIERSAQIAAREATADGINWTYGPMVDIALDQRWGRVCEGNGEDPFLGSCIARAMVKGFQGDLSSRESLMACVKHFALYGAVESGRDYNTVDMSKLRMFNQYFPPYKAAVDAGVGTVMSSFNLVDGVPATTSRWLLTTVLRDMWHFDGMVATDYGSVHEILSHGTAKDLKEASAQSINAGTDMDMCSQGFINTLRQSVEDGTVSEETINTACRRVLETKYKLGLFENPYKYCDTKRPKKDLYTAENRRAARELAAETFVLLKNQDNILPLKKQGKIALIGPLADTRSNIAGPWCVSYTPERYATLRESMAKALEGKATLLYAQGCNITSDAQQQKDGEFGKNIRRVDDAQAGAEALNIAKEADIIVCAMGESAEMSGECSSRSDLTLPDVQHELLAELVKTGKPVVLLNFSGRGTVLTWESKNVPAIMNVWFGGSEGGDAICDVLFGDKVPSGKLTVSMPQNTGQEPLYYNHLSTGRPVPEMTKEFRKFASNYLDVRNDALYPFGYGLSYTTFKYGDLRLSSSSMKKDGQVTATINVTNTGSRDADEVVQFYIRDLVASVARPVKELKGFQRVHLAAGESRDITFTITPDQLKFYNANLDYVLEPGDFNIMAGPDSRSLSTVKLTVTE